MVAIAWLERCGLLWMGVGLAVAVGAARLGQTGYARPLSPWVTILRGTLRADPGAWLAALASSWMQWVLLLLLLTAARSRSLIAAQRRFFGRPLGMYVWLGVIGLLVFCALQAVGGLMLFLDEIAHAIAGDWRLTGEALSEGEIVRAGQSVVWLACTLRVLAENLRRTDPAP